MLATDDTVLLIIDVQGKLAHLMYEKDPLFENLEKLIKGAKILELPILWTEQNPEKIGPTLPEIAQLLPPDKPIPKNSFSCCGSEQFLQELKVLDRKQILLTGIEAHICVYQTAVNLLNLGYEVEVVANAVSSRTAENKNVALKKMVEMGATVTSAEMALFELLRVAEGEKFKEILRIVK